MTVPRKPRIDFSTVTPDAYTAVLAFDRTVLGGARKAGVEPAVLHLLKIRASQLNGCAFCLDLHSREARQEGESEQRLAVLSAWRNAPLFTERERAALALAEAVTSLPDRQVPEEIYQAARVVFSEEEVAHLLLSATVINVWNRLSIATLLEPAPPQP